MAGARAAPNQTPVAPVNASPVIVTWSPIALPLAGATPVTTGAPCTKIGVMVPGMVSSPGPMRMGNMFGNAGSHTTALPRPRRSAVSVTVPVCCE